MKLRYRIIGIVLLIGIYFGYRHDPAEEFVMIRNISSPEAPIYPAKVSALRWKRLTVHDKWTYNFWGPRPFEGFYYDYSDAFIPTDVESAEKIEAYLRSR